MVPLRYHLKWDTIEILTNKTQRPTKDWLNHVRSGRARAKIKQYLQKEERDKAKEEEQTFWKRAAEFMEALSRT